MTLLMYLVNYTISEICHGNHSECARRLGMDYTGLHKHINRLKACGTSGGLMEALLEMYWRDKLSLDAVLKAYSETRFGSDMEAADEMCSELFSSIQDIVRMQPRNTQDVTHILNMADNLAGLIHKDFCQKYCDQKKYDTSDCPLKKYSDFIAFLKREMELSML